VAFVSFRDNLDLNTRRASDVKSCSLRIASSPHGELLSGPFDPNPIIIEIAEGNFFLQSLGFE
jgi:hypothetical protein